jgi:glycosyltransferase involved in cell wall biosynthesis
MLKILFVNGEKKFGEYEEQNLIIASALNKKGHKVFIALNSKSQLNKQAWMRGLPIIPIPFKYNVNPFAISKLSKVISKNDIDIIHVYDNRALPLAIKTAKKLNFRALVVTQHPGFPQKLNYFSRKLYLKKRFQMIVTSHYIKQVLEDQGLHFKNQYYLPEGVDLIRYKDTLPFDDFYTEFSIPPEFFLIGTQNPGSNEENISFLFDTFVCISRKRPNTIFVIFAEPENRKLLEQTIKQRNLLNRVLIFDQKHKVPNILSAINMMITPFDKVDYRCIILKAMAMAKPVITINHQRIDEIIQHGKDGIIVPDINSASLCTAVFELMNDEEKQIKLGSNAKKKIAKCFDICIIGTRLEELYTDILSKS